MKHRFKNIALVLSVFLLAWSTSAHSQTEGWDGADQAKVRLIAQTTAIGDREEVTLGLHFKMQDGWKVYWRSPGDAGYPPEIDWQNNPNIKSSEMRWPRPERFVVLGLETVGYKKEVVYPIRVKVNDPSQDLNIQAKVRYLTCAEICVPVEADLSLHLPAGPAQPGVDAQLVNKYESLVPSQNDPLARTIETATLYPDREGNKGTLRLKVASNNAYQNPDVLVEGPIELAFFKPGFQLSEDKKAVLVDVPLDGLKFLENGFEDHDFIITLMDGNQAVELKTKVMAGPAGMPPFVEGFSTPGETGLNNLPFVTILALAVLGGLILNLMPCVLPVLSLKVIGLVSHGGAAKGTVRLSFLASSAGILFSFWVLAGILVAMKMGGASIGWGIQFQQPLFLIALALIVILFACNMWGFFEIHLPGWLSNLGERSSHVHGLGGHFLTGAFATLLATPYSAPFLGTAVGFALARGPIDIFMVFSALGVGLALPYILIALFPGFATRLPKPGAWMVTLRKVLALLLLGTAGWLLSVLWVQIGLNGVIALSALMAGVILVLAMNKQLKTLVGPVVIALFLAAFAVPTFAQKDEIDKAQAEKLWTPFDLQKIEEEVARGQVVFVDVTAQWCITCQVNKNLVLYRGDAFAALSDAQVTPMKADWTNPDETIAAYLASFGRYAIPFNAVYGPGAPKGIVLPELLDEETVLNAIEKAKG